MRKNLFSFMKSRGFSLLLCLLVMVSIFPVTVSAATMNDVPESIDAPVNVAVSTETDVWDKDVLYNFNIGYSAGESLKKLGQLVDSGEFEALGYSGELYVQADYKYNESGTWHYESSWDTIDRTSIDSAALFENYSAAMYPEENAEEISIPGKDIEPAIQSMSELKDNTLYFRVRFVFQYFKLNADDSTTLISPWSDTVVIGKNASANKVTSVEAPTLVKAELKKHDDGSPYFEITTRIPESVKTLHNGQGDIIQYQSVRKSGGGWSEDSSSGTGIHEVFTVNPDDIGIGSEINIEAASYDMRVRYGYTSGSDGDIEILSPYSNIVTIGTPSYYKNASSWAVAELDKALEYGFITSKIRDNISGPITREEFCEIVVKLYEKLTGITAEYSQNPFSDTSNPEILKAYDLGIVNGIGKGKFAPNNLVTRQEISVMLFRTMKMCRPQANFTVADVARFNDEAEIASWAIDAVRFMFKNGIIKGAGDGSVNPLGNTTRQEAVLLVVRTFEKFMD